MSSASAVDSASAPLAYPLAPGVSWPLLLGVAAFLIPVLAGWGLRDPDTYWHIAAGRWMLAHGAVLTHDPFSFTRRGAPWIAQEWGAELLIALVFRLAGWAGLVLLAAACFAGTLAYLLRFLLARMEPLHALVLAFLAGSMMFPSLLVRPHELVWPLTALWMGTLVGAAERCRAPPWWLLGVMLLWANLHASFILGLLLAVPIALEAVLGARPAWKPAARRWGLFLAAAVGCALANPQGLKLLIYPFRVLDMSALDYIAEWRPPDLQHLQILSLWLALILGLAFIGRIRLPLTRNVLVLGLLFMALQHVRNVALLGLLAPFLLAAPVAAVWRGREARGRDAAGPDRCLRALTPPAPRAAALAAIALAAVIAAVAVRIERPHPPAAVAPRAALAALLARGAGGRILNDYSFGGYLIFRGVPVFVDGRADLYGDAFLRRMVDALSLSPGGHLRALLRKYRISGILLRPDWPAVKLLNRMPAWRRVYATPVAVAYVPRQQDKTT